MNSVKVYADCHPVLMNRSGANENSSSDTIQPLTLSLSQRLAELLIRKLRYDEDQKVR